jgi:hypothetical protein
VSGDGSGDGSQGGSQGCGGWVVLHPTPAHGTPGSEPEPARVRVRSEPARNRAFGGGVRRGPGGFRLPPPVEGEGGRGQSSPTRIALTFRPKPRIIGYPTSEELE